jgi:hypothetical protein
MQPSLNKKLIVSRFSEDVSWIKDYSLDYLVYNKGEDLPGYNCLSVPNIGNNQRDIFHFIYNNYESLPEIMIFVQGGVFYHCNKIVFDLMVENKDFAYLETSDLVGRGHWRRDSEGYFIETNNDWYIEAQNQNYKQECKYNSYNEFMNKYFLDYRCAETVRFCPGSQYIIPKEKALKYTKYFWNKLMNELTKNNMTEGHIIERALGAILDCKLTPRF